MNETAAGRTVLLVEDEENDFELTRRALQASAQSIHLVRARDGLEALAMLRDGIDPELIIVDMNMPRMDGRGFLSRMQEQPDWQRIPVIVLTTSTSERDVRSAYDLQANCYLVKPVNFSAFQELIAKTSDYWLNVARLPAKGALN